MIGDDLLADHMFPRGRLYLASGPAVVVRPPRSLHSLIAVLARHRRGPAEQSIDTGRSTLRELLQSVSGPASGMDALCYALLAAAGRRRARRATRNWERDFSSRGES